MKIHELEFDREKDIQSITKMYIETIFDIELIKDEFSLGGDRVDILAYDKNNQSFVIIEFKKGRKKGILEQLKNYLNLAKKNKNTLCQQYGKKHDRHFDVSEVNWDNVRGIAVAPSFDKYQRNFAEDDDQIELCEVHRYENGIFEFELINSGKQNIKDKILGGPKPQPPDSTLTARRCPSCTERKDIEEIKSWTLHNGVPVTRFRCKCRQLFNYYKTKSGGYTIPKPRNN